MAFLSSPGALRVRLLSLCVAFSLAALLVLLALERLGGQSGLSEVRDEELAVVLDGWSGATRTQDTPGLVLHLPFAQEVHRLRRAPFELVLEGEASESEAAAEPADPFLRPELVVRASDGSRYRFRRTSVVFALDPEQARAVLFGLGADPRRWARFVHASASAILVDELGRHGSEEIVVPATAQEAFARARERLGRALEERGLRLVALGASELAFDRDWERAVERRKVHDQQVAYLGARQEELVELRARRLAETHTEVELALHEWRARLALDEREAERELFVARAQAERAFQNRLADGRAALEARRAQAEASSAREGGAVQAFAAELDLLERSGEAAVREALVERLERTSFVLEPFARDAEPQRVEQVAGGKP